MGGGGDGNHSGAEKVLIRWKAPSPQARLCRHRDRASARSAQGRLQTPTGYLLPSSSQHPSQGERIPPDCPQGVRGGAEAPRGPALPKSPGARRIHLLTCLAGAVWRSLEASRQPPRCSSTRATAARSSPRGGAAPAAPRLSALSHSGSAVRARSRSSARGAEVGVRGSGDWLARRVSSPWARQQLGPSGHHRLLGAREEWPGCCRGAAATKMRAPVLPRATGTQ